MRVRLRLEVFIRARTLLACISARQAECSQMGRSSPAQPGPQSPCRKNSREPRTVQTTQEEKRCTFKIESWMTECATRRGLSTVRLWLLELARVERAAMR